MRTGVRSVTAEPSVARVLHRMAYPGKFSKADFGDGIGLLEPRVAKPRKMIRGRLLTVAVHR